MVPFPKAPSKVRKNALNLEINMREKLLRSSKKIAYQDEMLTGGSLIRLGL